MVTRRVELQHHLITLCCKVEIPENCNLGLIELVFYVIKFWNLKSELF